MRGRGGARRAPLPLELPERAPAPALAPRFRRCSIAPNFDLARYRHLRPPDGDGASWPSSALPYLRRRLHRLGVSACLAQTSPFVTVATAGRGVAARAAPLASSVPPPGARAGSYGTFAHLGLVEPCRPPAVATGTFWTDFDPMNAPPATVRGVRTWRDCG